MSGSMPTLAQTQRQLQRWILCESPHQTAAPQRALLELIAGDPKQAAQRAGIYHTAYRLRLDEVLANDYPVLATVAGEAFAAIAERYRRAHPSRHPSARWYGRHLSAMLGDSALGDLASLEWALGEAFDAADADPVVLEDLAGLPADAWAGLGFAFHPSLRLLSLKADLAPVLAAESPQQHDPIERRPEAADWLVWRHRRQAHWRVLTADEAASLRSARVGASFEALCEQLCEWHPPEHVAQRAAGLLKRWIVDGLVAGLRHPAMR
jgi:hypothetical protein